MRLCDRSVFSLTVVRTVSNLASLEGFFHCPLMVFGLSDCRAFPFSAERTKNEPPFHPSRSWRTWRQKHCDTGHPRTHDHGRLPLNLAVRNSAPSPYVGLTEHCAVSFVRVRPSSVPVDSDFRATFDRVKHSIRPWTCHHTRQPTVLSRESMSPIPVYVDRFHSLACYPGAPLG